MTKDEIDLLVKSLCVELREASQKYYEGDDIMSDTEFDSKYSFLQTIDPTNPIFSEVSKGYKLKGIDDKEKFEHLIPVGSVDKINELSDLKKWLKPGATFSTKIDGNSIVAYYNDGFLSEVVTRGSENIGIIRTGKFIKKLKKKIDVPGSIAVRGEAAIKRSVFKANGKLFDLSKASRNSVAGAITRQDNYEQVMDLVDLLFYTFIDCETGEDISDKYDWSKWFTVESQKPLVDFTSLSLEEFKKKYKDDYDYEADGVVFKNPDGSLKAFKFEDETANTKLLGVEWTIGKDQRLTPVALLEEVSLCGANISRASMGSYSRAVNIAAWPVYDTHVVEIKRANEVIPYVKRVVSRVGSVLAQDVVCPVCGSSPKTKGEHIFCTNETCGNIEYSRLMAFSEEFYPEGLSNTTTEKFFNAYGITTLEELLGFSMPVRRKEIYGIGDSAYEKFVEFINKISANELDVAILLRSVVAGCGRRASKKIVDSDWDFGEYISAPIASLKKLYRLPSFNSTIVDDMLKKYSVFQRLSPLRTWKQNKSVKTIGTFCITGARFKPEQKEIITKYGWGEDESIKKTTTILVTKNPDVTTSKIEKARKYGIQIMSVDAFLSHISK